MVLTYEKVKIKLSNGDEIILKDFFDTNFPVFCSYAAKFISDSSICEDIVQDIFIKFWENRNTFLNIFTVKAFFYKSIRNSCLDISDSPKGIYFVKIETDNNIIGLRKLIIK